MPRRARHPRARPVQRLLEEAAAGDRAAATALYDRYAPGVAAYVRSQGSRDVAGVTNEVFGDAFAAIARFAGDARGFRSWLFAIAHAKVVDERRRSEREVAVADGADPADAGAMSASAEDEALLALDDAGMSGLLALLTPAQRDVVLLRVVADLSVEETAAAVGRSPGAVKVLQHRAMLTLRAALDPEHAES